MELPGTGAAASCRMRSRAGTLPSGASCHLERGSCPRTGCWVLHEVMEKSAGVPCAQCKPAAAAGGVHLRHKLLPPLCDIAPLAHVGLPESVPRSLPRCRGFAEQGFMSLLSPVPLSLMIFAAALPSHCGGALWRPAHTSLLSSSSSTNPGKSAFSYSPQEPLLSPVIELSVVALHKAGCWGVFVSETLDTLSVGCGGARSGSVCPGSHPRPLCRGWKLGSSTQRGS